MQLSKLSSRWTPQNGLGNSKFCSGAQWRNVTSSGDYFPKLGLMCVAGALSGSKFIAPVVSKLYDLPAVFWTQGFASFAPREAYQVTSFGKWRPFLSDFCKAEILRFYGVGFSSGFRGVCQNACLSTVNSNFIRFTRQNTTQHVFSATQVQENGVPKVMKTGRHKLSLFRQFL